MRAHLYFTEAKSEISLKVVYIEIAVSDAQVMTIGRMGSKMAD